jgi:hypothetical protein
LKFYYPCRIHNKVIRLNSPFRFYPGAGYQKHSVALERALWHDTFGSCNLSADIHLLRGWEIILKLGLFGAAPESSSFGLAVSLAAVLALLARRRTLLVDFSLEPDMAQHILGEGYSKSIEALVDQFIHTGGLSEEDVREQVTQYSPPAEFGLANRTLDLLASPEEITPRYRDRVAAQRGAEFAVLLATACERLEYEFTIINLGRSLDTVRGLVLTEHADLTIAVCQNINAPPKAWSERLRVLDTKPSAQSFTVKEYPLQFPDKDFVKSLVTPGKVYENTASRLALIWAELLSPSISSELTDGSNNHLTPYRGTFLQQLFGQVEDTP